MPIKVYASLALTIPAMVFAVFILIMYVSKKKYRGVENIIYICLLAVALLLLVTETMHVYAINKEYDSFPTVEEYGIENFRFFITFNKMKDGSMEEYAKNTVVINGPISKPITYIYVCLTSIWLGIITLYIWSLGFRYREKKARKWNYIRMFSVVIGVVALCIIVILNTDLVIEQQKVKGLYQYNGDVVYAVFMPVIMMTIALITLIIRTGKKIPKQHMIPLISSYVIAISEPLFEQLVDLNINATTFLFIFVLTTIYFTVESQDYNKINELLEKKKEAEEKNLQKTAFLSNMSHEIRTPLNTIIGFSESLLNEEHLTKEILERDAKSINDASVVLYELINNILEISKIESGEEQLKEKEYSLQDINFELKSRVLSKIEKDNIKFEIETEENIPQEYHGDYEKIIRVLLCIIRNAIKYTSFGEIKVKILGQKAEKDKYELSFVVSNTGHAMKQEDFDKDYDDFIILESGIQNTIDSTTLGLIIGKKLTAIMNGKISFENEPGKGTIYHITIPQKVKVSAQNTEERKLPFNYETKEEKQEAEIDVEEQKEENEIAKDTETATEEEKKEEQHIVESDNVQPQVEEQPISEPKRKILIVESSKENLEKYKTKFASYDCNVDVINNYDNLYQELKNKINNTKYDIAFINDEDRINNNIENLRDLLIDNNELPPVIGLIEKRTDEIKAKLKEDGFSGYITKPINPDNLDMILERYFNK